MQDESTAYYVEEVTELTSDIVDKLAALPRLSAEPQATNNFLPYIVTAPQCALLIIRDSKSITGSLIINLNYKEYYIEARIDELIIDTNVQGHGLGTKLMQGALTWCKDHGAKSIELTSRPSRIAANKLYLKLGFEIRETNVFKLHF